MHQKPVVVVGAGVSGVACAVELRSAGLPVRVLDRGRRIGGRMASRRLDGRVVDLGASYLTASDPAFAAVVDDWHERGLAAPWTDTFCALAPGEPASLKEGPVRWGAPGGLRSLVDDLATGLDVEQREVRSVAELAASAVVLAMPDPQASRLLGPDHPVTAHLDRDYEPVLALAARWPARTWDDLSPTGHFDGAFVNGDHVLAWVADDGRRRGDDAPMLVAHSTPDFARPHLAEPAAAQAPMLAALRVLMSLGEPTETYLHRWSFARPTGERSTPYLLVDEPGLLGVCGDGWGETSKVETAWRSGRDLGRALAARLA